MSLYNALFGVNPLAGTLLQALDLEITDIPRFRDCYLHEVPNEPPLIAVHTRTGGGNRAFYENEDTCRRNNPDYFTGDDETIPKGPWNDDLRALNGYVRDEDDAFDHTYATFYFEIPATWASIVTTMREISGGTKSPGERWQQLMVELKEHPDSPVAKRAIKYADVLFTEINQILEGRPMKKTSEMD